MDRAQRRASAGAERCHHVEQDMRIDATAEGDAIVRSRGQPVQQ